MTLGTIILILCLTVCVQGHQSGAPLDACGTMTPGHGRQPQSTSSPYTISFSKSTYSPNEQIQVTLQGSPEFKGFFIQPRQSQDGLSTYGSIPSFPPNTRNPCSNGAIAITHTNKDSKSSVTFTWVAPASDEGPIIFVYTVVQSFNTYWVRAQSNPLTYQALPPVTNPTTQPTQPVTTVQATTSTTQAPTTAIVDNNRPMAINKESACGVTKSCFPADCTTDCDYLVMWEDVDTETMKFTLQKKTTSPNHYIAIGLSADPFMKDDSVTHCVSQNGQVIVKSTYNVNSDSKYNEDLDNTMFGLELVDGYYANGILGCTYNRKKNATFASNAVRGRKKRAVADAATFFDIESDWFLFVAEGNVIQGTTPMHSTRPVISTEEIDFQTIYGSNTGTTADPTSGPSEVKKDSKCGSEVGCFHDCKGDNCNFLLTWKDDGGDEVLFTCACKQGRNRYCAFGLSSDEKMGDDSVIACGPSGGSTEVKNFYNDGKVCKSVSDPSLGIRLISSSNVNGVLAATFARKKSMPGVSTFFDLNQDWTLLYAAGPYIGGFVTKHSSRPQASASKADFQKTEDMGAEESSVDLVYLHATLMVSAWMFFASFGIFTARYYKGVWPDEAKLCGEKRWFTIHRMCMIMVFLLCAAGFAVIFVHVEGYSDIQGTNWQKSHPIIGIVVMAIAVINPVMALFRPHPGTRFRPVFNVFHAMFGTGAYSLSIVNVFSGTWLSTTNVPSYIRIVLYVFVGWIVVTELVFTYLTHCRKKERSQDYEMTTRGASGYAKEPSKGGDGCKSLFLVLHVLVLMGFAAAVAIIVWTQRDNE